MGLMFSMVASGVYATARAICALLFPETSGAWADWPWCAMVGLLLIIRVEPSPACLGPPLPLSAGALGSLWTPPQWEPGTQDVLAEPFDDLSDLARGFAARGSHWPALRTDHGLNDHPNRDDAGRPEDMDAQLGGILPEEQRVRGDEAVARRDLADAESSVEQASVYARAEGGR